MAIGFYSATVTTDASGDGTSTDWNGSFSGLLRGVRIAFGASPAATTDTTLTEPNGLQRTLATWTDTDTDGTTHPAAAIEGATDAFMPYAVDSNNLLVTVAQGGDSKTVTVTVLIESER